MRLRILIILAVLATLAATDVHASSSVLPADTTRSVVSVSTPRAPRLGDIAAGTWFPLTLVAAGASGFTEPVLTWKVDVRNGMRHISGRQQYSFDNYLQYLPTASALTLDYVGIPARHDILDRALILGTSYVSMTVLVNLLKYTADSPRPYIYDSYHLQGNPQEYNPYDHPQFFSSFPSGHTATAFLGAELVRLEYGDECPWVAVGAYAVATSVGFMRVYNEKHWITDVLAGAGLGILGAHIGWWLLPTEQRIVHAVFPRITMLSDGRGGQLTLSFNL